MPPSTVITGLSGSIAGKLDELPRLADLDHLGHLKERQLAWHRLSTRRARQDHRVFVKEKVLGQAGRCVGRYHVGHHPVEPAPDCLLVPANQALQQRPRTDSTLRALAAATRSTSPAGTPSTVNSSGVARTVSISPRSPVTRPWTKTFDASSAEIRSQPVILPREGWRSACRQC